MATSSDFDALRPVLFVSGDSSSSIIYSPGGPEYHQHRSALEAHGIEGSGYDFSGALQAVLTDQAPATLDAVGFDPEGGMVSVYGNDLDALLVAARTLHTLVTDADALGAALARSVELGLDD
ncbi:Imm51 family immunity protein [Rhodococcus maanshanensis]|uniref:Immunity protein 51 n=1 Tax=Rhodococcus maanshanensis TaxID=183556 RepID=A0A1H7H736_9NOCA|nr:Imm51 family immunity protein [Rhodococcus maanshanensis]SEK45577.1 Immunity protein 51 [Rhodococcus maanshanensis]